MQFFEKPIAIKSATFERKHAKDCEKILNYSRDNPKAQVRVIERTKRHFNGTVPTGKKISDLLPHVLNEIVKKAGDNSEEIFQFWFSLIGEKMVPLTQPISLKNGVLTIKVKSATLYSLLCQHEKPRLLKELKDKFEMKDLVFRVG